MNDESPIELWGTRASRRSDQYTMDTLGIPSVILMERAALSVSHEVQRIYQELRLPIHILSGPGNNGADGLAVSRILAGRGIPVEVSLLTKRVEGIIAEQLEWTRQYGVQVHLGVPEVPKTPRIIVDALLGTGSSGIVRGLIGECLGKLVPWQIERGIAVVAVDVPTGVDADSGAVLGPAFRARCTVSFQRGKPGLFITPGSRHSGKVVIADIGLREAPRVPEDSEQVALLSPTWASHEVARIFTAREHKGQGGSVGVVGGSAGTPGAAILAGYAALKSGAGTVHVLSNDSQIQEQILRYRPELMCSAVMSPTTKDEGEPGSKSKRLSLASHSVANAWVIGPGLCDRQALRDISCEFLDDLRSSIWDASALDVIEFERTPAGERVLSPHPGEASRLLNRWQIEHNPGGQVEPAWDSAAVQGSRRDVVMRLSEITRSTVILKGEHSLIAKNRRLVICPTGSSTLATAGSGDCLAGIVGALLAQGVPSWTASCLAVYLHGICGELLEANTGTSGALASDIVDSISKAVTAVRGGVVPNRWPRFVRA